MQSIKDKIIFGFLLLISGVVFCQEFTDKKFSQCGLGYEVQTIRTSLRASNASNDFPMDTMPVFFNINFFKEHRDIIKVYLFASISGENTTFKPTLMGLDSLTYILNYSEIEKGDDPCWSYSEKNLLTYDITEYVSVNGKIELDGFPLSSSLTGTDTDGLMLLAIYSDYYENFVGNLYLSKGVISSNLATSSYTISDIVINETTAEAQGFVLIADLQDQGSKISINNSALFGVTDEEFWDFEFKSTAVIAGQNSSTFKLEANNDCAHLLMAGLYFKETYDALSPTLNRSGDTLISSDGYSYDWFVGDSSLSESGNVLVATYPGNYQVILTDTLGCKSNSNVVNVSCFENYELMLMQENRVISADTFYVDYKWFKNGVLIATGNNDTLIANDSASYYLVVTDSLGCEYQSRTIEFLTVSTLDKSNSLEENEFLLQVISLENKIIVSADLGYEDFSFEIYDLSGKLCYRDINLHGETKKSYRLRPGIYVLKINSDTNQRLIKTIVR